jgi:hypothetical protein
MADEIRHTYTFITDTNVVMLRSHYEQLVKERDEARAELKKSSDDFHDVWESRDKVIEERERARQACNAYWHDLSRIGSLCEQSADEYPLKAVERMVREFRAVIAERDAMKARIASMMESMSMACEEPPANCECAGCSYAREKGGDV